MKNLCLYIFALTLFSSLCLANDNNLNEQFIVSLKANYQESDVISTVIETSSHEILLPLEDLKTFNIKPDYLATALITLDKIEHVNLGNLQSTTYNLDKENLTLEINFPALAMPTQFLNSRAEVKEDDIIGKPASGAFLNYDLTLTKSDQSQYIAGIQQFNYFTNKGVLNYGFFLKQESTRKTSASASGNQITRLNTNWTSDNEQDVARWRIGDSITRAANWSGATRFIGIQHTTNFALRPDLITRPLLDFQGKAELPTILDVYSKSLPIYHAELKTGGYDINNLPVTAGKGEITVRTQDITGKVETITLPFYSVPSLLKSGLSDYSFAIGVQRLQYGVKDNDYGAFITNIDYEYGVNNSWTSGAHFESLNKFSSIGVTNSVALNQYGSLTVSLATNIKKIKDAQKAMLAYGFSTDSFSFNTNISKNGEDFRDTYNSSIKLSSKPTYQTSISYSDDKWGNFNISYLSFDLGSTSTGKSGTKMISGTYTRNFTKDISGRLSIGTDLNNKKAGSFITASLLATFGTKTVSFNKSRQGKVDTTQYDISQPLNTPLGWGYKTSLTTHGKDKDYSIEIDKNFQKVNTALYLFNYGKSKTQQLTLSGSIVNMDKNIFFTAPIYNGLALVKAGNIKGIPVLNNNILVGYTNSSGQVLVPNVVPYVPSEISLDSTELPLDTEFSTATAKTIVKGNSGVIIDFAIVRQKSAMMTLLDSTGKVMPFNHPANIEEIEEEIFIGYEGQIYVNDIKDLTSLHGKVCDDSNCCQFEALIDQNSKDPILDLGEIICK